MRDGVREGIVAVKVGWEVLVEVPVPVCFKSEMSVVTGRVGLGIGLGSFLAGIISCTAWKTKNSDPNIRMPRSTCSRGLTCL